MKSAMRECCVDLLSESREIMRLGNGGAGLLEATESREASGLLSSRVRTPSNLTHASFSFLIPFSWGRAEPTVAELVRVQGQTAIHRRTMNSSLGAAERHPLPAGSIEKLEQHLQSI